MTISHAHWTLTDVFRIDYAVEAICNGCGQCKVLPPEHIARFTSWETNLSDVIRKLKCERCQRRTAFTWKLVKRPMPTRREARDMRNN